MSYIVGAYAASPCHTEWKPEWEARYLSGLAAIDGIAGLELPFFGELHRHDSDWLLAHLPRAWNYVLTAIPGVMEQVGTRATFGLASHDERGRAEALHFTEKMRQAVCRLNRAFGRPAVRAVEVHSAPKQGTTGVAASGEAFLLSLREVAQWDWEGAEILVEHCDRFREGQVPAKGFLSLADEIAAVRSLSAKNVRLLINWGRSAIEERDAEAPRRHLQRAETAGVLGGVIFSGVTTGDPLYGDWADSHAPFAGTIGGGHSLMTAVRVAEAMRIAYRAVNPVIGLKIQALPKTLTVEERLAAVAEWVRALRAARPATEISAHPPAR